ncbi:zinc ribbon domain-containing protein [Gloeocapsa sp. PCC 73106]|uniref:zinc ribbon domain-containing protein n=1 Tax=Gloeocapsa sp. PCC 73106 TaxID=102232 RepID=UPI0002ACFDF8|nr:zinc ribbon domain-containing protein [Gloeocapsa sp. PCC 73106]ELR98064.1 hypothetical protein GLO73106DRAFT_00018860 [Gloeocapsa sp. PCC 73106]
MIPSHLANKIQKSIAQFLLTEFRPTTPGFKKLIEEFLHKEDSILKGPYISLEHHFRDFGESDVLPDTPHSDFEDGIKGLGKSIEEGMKGLGELFAPWDLSEKKKLSTDILPSDLEDLSGEELGKRLKSLAIIHNLLGIFDHHQVISLEDLWQELGQKMSLPDDPELLTSLIALCAKARNPQGGPWVNIEVDFWLRKLNTIVATVSNQPKLVYFDDLTSEAKSKTLPVVHCRGCGNTGWGGLRKHKGEGIIACELKDFSNAYSFQSPLITYIFPSETTLSHQLCSNCLTLNKQDADHCYNCGGENLIRVIEPVDLNKTGHHDCPFCGNEQGLVIWGEYAASLVSKGLIDLVKQINDKNNLDCVTLEQDTITFEYESLSPDIVNADLIFPRHTPSPIFTTSGVCIVDTDLIFPRHTSSSS